MKELVDFRLKPCRQASGWAWKAFFCCLLFTGNDLTVARATIVGAPPVITTQPKSQSVQLGGNATLSVAVTSSSALTYHWYFNGVAIAGGTTNIYTRSNVQFTNAGAYYVTVANSGGSINSSNATLNVLPTTNYTLAAPWVTADIGSVGLTGSAYGLATSMTVNGAGANQSGLTADDFRYVYQTMPGNGSLTARIIQQSGTNANGFAGIMIRETTQTGSRFLAAARQDNGATLVRSRISTGGATTSVSGPTLTMPNFWLKLTRSGTNITAMSSTNGSSWTAFRTNAVAMATNVTFGIVVSSGNTNVLDSDVFTNMSAIP